MLALMPSSKGRCSNVNTSMPTNAAALSRTERKVNVGDFFASLNVNASHQSDDQWTTIMMRVLKPTRSIEITSLLPIAKA
jgi:hypothetical protein